MWHTLYPKNGFTCDVPTREVNYPVLLARLPIVRVALEQNADFVAYTEKIGCDSPGGSMTFPDVQRMLYILRCKMNLDFEGKPSHPWPTRKITSSAGVTRAWSALYEDIGAAETTIHTAYKVMWPAVRDSGNWTGGEDRRKAMTEHVERMHMCADRILASYAAACKRGGAPVFDVKKRPGASVLLDIELLIAAYASATMLEKTIIRPPTSLLSLLLAGLAKHMGEW